jgi:hypothetical protein
MEWMPRKKFGKVLVAEDDGALRAVIAQHLELDASDVSFYTYVLISENGFNNFPTATLRFSSLRVPIYFLAKLEELTVFLGRIGCAGQMEGER